MYLRAFTPVKLSEQGFATEADRAFYTSFDANRDGIISLIEHNAFLRDQGLPEIKVVQPVVTTASPASQAAPIIPLALLAYLFLS